MPEPAADPGALLPPGDPVRLLDTDGTYHEDPDHPVDLDDPQLLELYRLMVVIRRVDREAINLQRQGQLGVYSSCLGQEAAQVGSAFALAADDWIFPSYRELGAAFVRGVDPVDLLHLYRGTWLSDHDPYDHNVGFVTIPIGTQVLHATGYAMGAQLDGRSLAVMTYFGDGGTSAGDTHEALTFAGVWRSPVVFFVQNNRYAISLPLAEQTAAPTLAHKAVGYGIPGRRCDGNDVLATYAVTRRAVDRAHAGEGPTLIEAMTYRMEAHTTSDDPSRYRTQAELEAAALTDPISRMRVFLERRGLLDVTLRRDIDEQAQETAVAMREQIYDAPHGDPMELFAHVYVDATGHFGDQPALLRSELEAADATPEDGGSEPMTYTLAQAINTALADAMEADEKVLVLGEDVGRLGGVFRVTDGLQQRFTDRRCFDTPLAEAGIIGTAIGLALYGYRPVPELQFDAFSYPAFEQLVSHLAKLRNRSRGTVRLPVTVRIPYGGGIGAVEHHSESPETYWAHTAGLTVFTPGTPEDGYAMMREAIALDDPVIFLEPKRRYWMQAEGELPVTTEPARRAVVRRAGTDVSVFCYGPMVRTAVDAADAATDAGWSLEVVDLRSLAPLDTDGILASVRRTGRAIVVHEASRTLGIGAEVAARIQEGAFFHLEAPVLRVTGFDTPYPPAKLESYWLPDVERILAAVERSLAT